MFHDTTVQNSDAAASDGSERQLFVAGHSKLPQYEYVERQVKGGSHLERDRNAASWDTEHNHVITVRILLQA